jgi:hypothetical protein
MSRHCQDKRDWQDFSSTSMIGGYIMMNTLLKYKEILCRTLVALAVLLFSAIASDVAYSYTERSGSISSDETWDASTYLITGDLTVDKGVTLTINPGEVVKFLPGVEITVNGALVANGISGNLVVFTCRDDAEHGETDTLPGYDGVIGSTDYWDGIRLYGQGSNEGRGQFNWCRIRYGGNTNGSVGANVNFYKADTASSYFKDSISEYSASYGVSVTSCSPTFRRSRIAENTSYGIYIDGSGTSDLGTDADGQTPIDDPGLNTIRDNDSGSVPNEYQLYNDTNNTVDAYYNYWGYTTVADIDTHIYDDDEGGGLVNFDPFSTYEPPVPDRPYAERSGSILSDETWYIGTYLITGDLTVDNGATLTISPGVVVKFLPGMELTVNGALVVNGNSGNLVVFTCRDDPEHGETDTLPGYDGIIESMDYWDGIYLDGSGKNDGICQFDWCRVRYGGNTSGNAHANVYLNQSTSGNFTNSISEYSADYGMQVYNCSPTITSSTFADSGNQGLYVSGLSAAPIITDNTFTNNSGAGIFLDNVALTSYLENDGTGNGINGFEINGGAVSANCTWSTGSSTFPFVITGTVMVDDDVTLTLSAGAIIKVDGPRELVVNGTLDVNGISGNPVVFTSLLDDEYGGDTNGDGSATSPTPGDWCGIYLDGVGKNDGIGRFDRCRIRYGGNTSGNADANVYLNQSDLGDFSNSISEYSANHGVSVTSCSPVFRSSSIVNNASYGVYVDGAATPDLGTDADGQIPIDDPGLNTIRDNDSSSMPNDYQLHNNTSNTLDAYYNYWGYTTVADIDTHIYDDDEGGGLVNFDPFSTDDPPIPGRSYTERSGSISSDETWDAGTYLITGDLTVDNGVTLTINPGVVVKFLPGMEITVNGALVANGASGNLVVFTCRDDPGHGETDTLPGYDGVIGPTDYWDGIRLYGQGANEGRGQFDWCRIRYGGNTNGSVDANVSFYKSDPDNNYFKDSISEYSANYGVSVTSCSPTFRRSRIAENSSYGVYTDVLANPDLGTNGDSGGNSIRDNDAGSIPNEYQVYNNTSNTINAVSNYWGYTTASEIDVHIRDNEEGGGEILFNGFLSDDPTGVVLSSFTAMMRDGKVTLIWRTEAEINNVGFAIYRSDTKDSDYTKIAFVPGAEDSETSNDYLFTDEQIQPGRTYRYYLEGVDLAGRRMKSDVIQVSSTETPHTRKPELPSVELPAWPQPILPTLTEPERLPKQNSLLANYPNPSNPETWIPYNLAEPADVTVQIYDVRGHLIRTLHLGHRRAGFYLSKDRAAHWDGRDDTGERAGSGIYFYRLSAESFSAVRKMVILE